MGDDSPLYPPDFIEAETRDPAGDPNAPFLFYLCQSANSFHVGLRAQVERCYGAVPRCQRGDWSGRLQSKDNDNLVGAMFDLFAWHYFARNGWVVQHEPPAPTGRGLPDLLATRPGGAHSYVEVKAYLEKQWFTKLKAEMDLLGEPWSWRGYEGDSVRDQLFAKAKTRLDGDCRPLILVIGGWEAHPPAPSELVTCCFDPAQGLFAKRREHAARDPKHISAVVHWQVDLAARAQLGLGIQVLHNPRAEVTCHPEWFGGFAQFVPVGDVMDWTEPREGPFVP